MRPDMKGSRDSGIGKPRFLRVSDSKDAWMALTRFSPDDAEEEIFPLQRYLEGLISGCMLSQLAVLGLLNAGLESSIEAALEDILIDAGVAMYVPSFESFDSCARGRRACCFA